MLRLGIDVDGVVADFRSAFRELAQQQLGIAATAVEADLTKGDVDKLWKAVASTANWWVDVPPHEPDQVARLYAAARRCRWEVYFLTSRPPSAGDSVQLQTQVWLERYGYYLPSVLMTPAGARGEIARSLRLDLVVDDRLVNDVEVISASNSKALLLARGGADPTLLEHAEARGIGIVTTLEQAIDAIERLQLVLGHRRGRLLRLAEWFHGKQEKPTLPHDPRQRST